MTLSTHEFIRRFLIHVLPEGFHRIRHYGLFANGSRAENIAQARQLLNVSTKQREPSDAASIDTSEPQILSHPCPCCGGRMIISRAAARRNIAQRRRRSQSRSTPHDPDRRLTTRKCSHLPSALDRPQRRSANDHRLPFLREG
jgi:predicted RNA-binding Zn-ribbon protein involved in translation (DUF1610 family)